MISAMYQCIIVTRFGNSVQKRAIFFIVGKIGISWFSLDPFILCILFDDYFYLCNSLVTVKKETFLFSYYNCEVQRTKPPSDNFTTAFKDSPSGINA